jgi:hypothetical protein
MVSFRGLFIDKARKEQYTLDDLLRSDLPSSGSCQMSKIVYSFVIMNQRSPEGQVLGREEEKEKNIYEGVINLKIINFRKLRFKTAGNTEHTILDKQQVRITVRRKSNSETDKN